MEALDDLVRTAVSRAPGSVVADRRTSVPAGEALLRAEEVAAEVRATAGCDAPVVAVELRASVDATLHLLAAVAGGYAVCFVDPAAPGERVTEVRSALRPDVVVDETGIHGAEDPGRRELTPGYVAMSSGSTGGGPKGVLTSWESLADFLPHGAESMALSSSGRWAEPSHPAYDLALTNWLLALSSGASLHVTASLVDRIRPLAFISRVDATHVRLAPRFIDLAVAEAQQGAPTGLRVWGSGGDRLTPAQARSVLSMGAATLVNTYGTSETGGFASAAVLASGDDIAARHGSVTVGSGQVGSWKLELVPSPTEFLDDEVLAISTPWAGPGYLFGGEGQVFPRWEPGRVLTGDRGAERDGEWFCLGRGGRLVKRSATFVNLDDVDLALRDRHGLVAFTVATRDGDLVTVVEEPTPSAAGRSAALLEELSAVVAPNTLPDAFVSVSDLPRLGNGKIDQSAVLLIAERLAH